MPEKSFKLMKDWSRILRYRDRITENNKNNEYGWNIYDSGLNSFDNYFRDIYPHEYGNLKFFIESKMEEKKGIAIGVELGGPGCRLFEDFNKNLFAKTFGMVLHKQPQYQDLDLSESKHRVIEGDCLSIRGIRKLEKILGQGVKIDVLFERMLGGIQSYYCSSEFIWSLFNRLYKLLNEGGMMFVQSPNLHNKDDKQIIQEWFNILSNDKFSGLIETRHTISPATCKVYLRKLKGAPAELPR